MSAHVVYAVLVLFGFLAPVPVIAYLERRAR